MLYTSCPLVSVQVYLYIVIRLIFATDETFHFTPACLSEQTAHSTGVPSGSKSEDIIALVHSKNKIMEIL